MSFATLSGILATDVANAGTFTTSYPLGPDNRQTNRGDFVNGTKHFLSIQQKVYSAPVDFTLAFGATTVTITNNTGTTLKAGARFTVQYDMPGGAQLVDENGVQVVNTVDAPTVLIDLGSPVAASAAALRAAAAVGGAGALTLITAALTLDVARNVTLTSSGNDSGRTFTVTGKDVYGNTVVEAITGANAGIASGKKAFKSITSISADAAAAGTVSCGYGEVLGLPVHLPITGLVLKEIEDSAIAAAGTLVAGLSVLTKPTATNADVRGTYDPNSACDGSKSFQLIAVLPDPTFKGHAQFAG
jgi:hypothetical protein